MKIISSNLELAKKYLVFISFSVGYLAQPTTLQAQPLYIPTTISNYILQKRYRRIKDVYYYSNEMKPRNALKLFSQIPQTGAYVTVGNADRGYINASLANTEAIVLFDYEPGVTAFNFMNTILLRISKDPASYRALRAHPEEAPKALYDEFLLEDIHLDQDSFWQELCIFWKFIHERFEQHFEPLLSPVGESKYCSDPNSKVIAEFQLTNLHFGGLLCQGGADAPFQDANFLYDTVLFNRVKKLASTAMIVNLDVTNAYALKELKNDLIKKRLKIAVLDISNLFSIEHFCKPDKDDIYKKYRASIITTKEFYITAEDFEQLIRILKPVGHPQAKILSTQWNKNMEMVTVESKGKLVRIPRIDWDYVLAPLKDVYSKKCKDMQITSRTPPHSLDTSIIMN